MQKFETRCWVPASIDDVWTFFSNPRNITQITPAYLRMDVESEESIHSGSTIVFTMRPYFYPIGLKWISKIHEVQATGSDRHFTDIQASGPFAHWKHKHSFSAGLRELKSASGKSVQVADGGTWIIDEIEYELPLGVLGKLADRLFSRKQMQANFLYRREQVARLFQEAQ